MTAGDFDPNMAGYSQSGAYPPAPYRPVQEPGGLGLRFLARVIDGILVNG